jgi:hypothetical protein
MQHNDENQKRDDGMNTHQTLACYGFDPKKERLMLDERDAMVAFCHSTTIFFSQSLLLLLIINVSLSKKQRTKAFQQ